MNKERKYTMTMEDLAPALADYGVTVRKAQYFPWTVYFYFVYLKFTKLNSI